MANKTGESLDILRQVTCLLILQIFSVIYMVEFDGILSINLHDYSFNTNQKPDTVQDKEGCLIGAPSIKLNFYSRLHVQWL